MTTANTTQWRFPTVRRWGASLAVFVLAAALRVQLLGQPLWKDERITRRFITENSLPELVWVIPVYQPHFPPYYLVLDALTQVTGDPVAGRWLSLAAGSLLPVVVYHWAESVLPVRRAVLAALLVAGSPLLVFQSYWLRMYALLALAVTVAWWLAWRWLHGRGSARAYLVAALVVVGLHPFGFIAVGSQLVWLALEHYLEGRRPPARVVGGVGVAIAGVVAVLAAKAVFHIQGTGIVHSLHVGAADTPIRRLVVLPLTTLTGTLYDRQFIVLAAIATGWLLVEAYQARIWRSRLGRCLACWVGVSLLGLLGAHTVLPVLQLKYLGWLAPGVALAIGEVLPRAPRKYILLGAIVGLVLAGLYIGYVEEKLVTRVAIYDSGVLEKLD